MSLFASPESDAQASDSASTVIAQRSESSGAIPWIHCRASAGNESLLALPNEARAAEPSHGSIAERVPATKAYLHCPTKREQRSHPMDPLPSECRQRKVPCLTPWGGRGCEASWVRLLPLGIDTLHLTNLSLRRYAARSTAMPAPISY